MAATMTFSFQGLLSAATNSPEIYPWRMEDATTYGPHANRCHSHHPDPTWPHGHYGLDNTLPLARTSAGGLLIQRSLTDYVIRTLISLVCTVVCVKAHGFCRAHSTRGRACQRLDTVFRLRFAD